ncbi:MAG: amidohydrolase [Phycisphaerae bacterium]|nr:amidohydrolase [Phycisphaerae bacterium]
MVGRSGFAGGFVVVAIAALVFAQPARVKPIPVRDRTDLRDAVLARIDTSISGWVELYKEMHAHPELSLMEKESAARVAKRLRQAGYEVSENVGGYGVVAVLRNGDGPTVLIRGDMDALPVSEETGLPYASRVKIELDDGSHVGVMHACGHDIHQTVLIGTGQTLAALKDRWSGTALLIAQPAEEIGKGARMMIDAGLFKRFPRPDACISLHDAHDVPAGSVGCTSGWVNANVDSVDIRIYGKGGHGAYPHQAIDPIVAASHVVVALQTITSRRIDPVESAVVTVGSIHGGTKHNIIPPHVDLKLTVRSYKEDVRRQVLDSIRQITTDTCRALACPQPPDMTVLDDQFTPASYNDPQLSADARALFQSLLGPDKVIDKPPTMGGEDFGQYAATLGVPGYMFWLGAGDAAAIEASKQPGGAPLPAMHSSKFAPIPEPTIRTGVRSLTSLALAILGEKKP